MLRSRFGMFLATCRLLGEEEVLTRPQRLLSRALVLVHTFIELHRPYDLIACALPQVWRVSLERNGPVVSPNAVCSCKELATRVVER